MRITRTTLTLVLVLCLSAMVFGQAAGTTPQSAPAPKPMPKLEPVLNHMPAGTLGYVVVTDLKRMNKNIMSFMGNIGLGMFTMQMPNGPIGMLQQMAPGFNPNGGLAVAFLDPKLFGLDLLEMMGMGAPASAPATTAPPELPLIIFVPGSNPNMFMMFGPPNADTPNVVNMGGMKMHKAKAGGYTVLSPSRKALDIVLAKSGKALVEIKRENSRIIHNSDIAAFINMKIVGPIYVKMLKKTMEMQAQAAAGAPGAQPDFAKPMMELTKNLQPFYEDVYGSMDSVVVGFRLAQKGVVIDETVSFDPTSKFGKATVAYKPKGTIKIDRVPNLPYVFAGGFLMQTSKLSWDIGREITMEMLEAMAPGKITATQKARIIKLFSEAAGEVKGGQFVMGGAPANSGVFGVSFLVDCANAEKLKGLLADKTALAEELIKTIVDDPQIQKTILKYEKGVEAIGSIKVDAITLIPPKLATIPESERSMLIKVLGEDKLRILIAAPTSNRLIITLGGSIPFMEEALKSAKTAKPVVTGAQFAEFRKYMPKNGVSLMAFSAANLIKVINTGKKIVEGETSTPIPFNITSDAPILMGSGITGATAHVAFYVPNPLIQEIVTAIMSMAMGPRGAGGGRGGPGGGPASQPDGMQ